MSEVRAVIEKFWLIATEAVKLNDDCVWVDEHTTIHEAIIDIAHEYDPVLADDLANRLQSDSDLNEIEMPTEPQTTFISFVTGKEEHTSNWGEFYVFGLLQWQAPEDSDQNRRDGHYRFQAYAANVPHGAIFSIHEREGNKRGTDKYIYRICRVNPSADPITIENRYTGCKFVGAIEILVQTDTITLSNRIAKWWMSKPSYVDSATWAEHCKQNISKRGQKEIPSLEIKKNA